MVEGFAARGWVRLPRDPALGAWLAHAAPAARRVLAGARARGEGFDCEGTWFVGVDALPNDGQGRVEGSGPLDCRALAFAESLYGPLPPLHPAQLSAVFPGYPRPRAGEGEAAFRYRARRDAAHVDGLLPVGPNRRRMIREPHAFILGLPLNACAPGASPLVLWEGSHEVMRRAFEAALAPHPPERWPEVDLTEPYQGARREVFETCRRVALPARPGEAYLLHRHLLHGIAPWEAGADAPAGEGRLIAYFRPEFPGGAARWLSARP